MLYQEHLLLGRSRKFGVSRSKRPCCNVHISVVIFVRHLLPVMSFTTSLLRSLHFITIPLSTNRQLVTQVLLQLLDFDRLQSVSETCGDNEYSNEQLKRNTIH
jgi:hypothetical protein